MTKWLRNIWEEVARPMMLRPGGVQFAALCTRPSDSGEDVLLITSRDTGRWVIPKGWPIDGLDGLKPPCRRRGKRLACARHALIKSRLDNFRTTRS